MNDFLLFLEDLLLALCGLEGGLIGALEAWMLVFIALVLFIAVAAIVGGVYFDSLSDLEKIERHEGVIEFYSEQAARYLYEGNEKSAALCLRVVAHRRAEIAKIRAEIDETQKRIDEIAKIRAQIDSQDYELSEDFSW